jgi:hypothetical protein
VPDGVKPFCKRALEFDCLRLAIFRCYSDLHIVDRHILFGGGGHGDLSREFQLVVVLRIDNHGSEEQYLLSAGCDSLINNTLLNICDPVREGCVQNGVDCDGYSCQILRVVESELVVPSKAGAGNSKGAIAKSQSCIGEGMNLLELQGVQVVGNCIIGSVLQICSLLA